LTFEEGNKIFKEVTGKDMPETYPWLAGFIKWIVADLGVMFKWLKENKTVVDGEEMKRRVGEMMGFREWLEKESGWAKK
jgi:hypothetical protein